MGQEDSKSQEQETAQSQETRDEIDRVFRAQYKRSVSYVMARGVEPSDAEDVVQDALAITIAKYDPARGAKVGSFFVTVLRSRCMEFLSNRHAARTRNGDDYVPHRNGVRGNTKGFRNEERAIDHVPDPTTTDRAQFLLSILPLARQVAQVHGCLDLFDAWYEWPRGRGAVGHAAGLLGPEGRAGGKANWKHKRKVAAKLDTVMRKVREGL